MEWKWQWFVAGLGGLLGLGLLRGILRILTPVAVVGVLGYGIATLLMRKRTPNGQHLPAVPSSRALAKS